MNDNLTADQSNDMSSSDWEELWRLSAKARYDSRVDKESSAILRDVSVYASRMAEY